VIFVDRPLHLIHQSSLLVVNTFEHRRALPLPGKV
jgi:hypothetical protein